MSVANGDSASVPLDDRLIDLVLQRATCGLSPEEGAELQQLLVGADRRAVDELEQSVDALRRGLDAVQPQGLDADEPMPEAILARILATAPARSGQSLAPTPTRSDGQRDVLAGPSDLARLRRLASLGWLAAAAAILIAAVAWLTRGGGNAVDPPARMLVDAASDVVRLPFASKIPQYAIATGEVVWSDRLQKGYMRLRGIAPNDASTKQYQLWIVDPARDERPVDGGVFDVVASASSDDEVIVPFTSRLVVDKPAVFAITAEKPGGVVVSAGPLLLVAARSG